MAGFRFRFRFRSKSMSTSTSKSTFVAVEQRKSGVNLGSEALDDLGRDIDLVMQPSVVYQHTST